MSVGTLRKNLHIAIADKDQPKSGSIKRKKNTSAKTNTDEETKISKIEIVIFDALLVAKKQVGKDIKKINRIHNFKNSLEKDLQNRFPEAIKKGTNELAKLEYEVLLKLSELHDSVLVKNDSIHKIMAAWEIEFPGISTLLRSIHESMLEE